jgi:hypothetical protein
MLYDNNNKNIKRGKGRPRKGYYYEIKPTAALPPPPEYCECTLCWRTYDVTRISLQQKIVDDRNFCESCWNSEIMAKQYQEQQSLIDELNCSDWSI